MSSSSSEHSDQTYDDAPYKHARRRIGEDRKKMLRILYDAVKPWSITDLENEAGARRGSRQDHIDWLQAKVGQGEWWPDELGPLVEVADTVGPRGTRHFVITEDGRKFVEALRETREIKTNEDFYDLETAYKQLRQDVNELQDLPERVTSLTESVEALSEAIENSGGSVAPMTSNEGVEAGTGTGTDEEPVGFTEAEKANLETTIGKLVARLRNLESEVGINPDAEIETEAGTEAESGE